MRETDKDRETEIRQTDGNRETERRDSKGTKEIENERHRDRWRGLGGGGAERFGGEWGQFRARVWRRSGEHGPG